MASENGFCTATTAGTAAYVGVAADTKVGAAETATPVAYFAATSAPTNPRESAYPASSTTTAFNPELGEVGADG